MNDKKDHCLLCGEEIKGGSPYSVCYDPHHEGNVWGGDTHEYIGYICEKCGRKIKHAPKEHF